MGFRFRKSINLGGGMRINLSKSGVGYSFGTKGYRVTKTAKGRTRTTIGVPNTGLSYVKETGKNNKNKASTKVNSCDKTNTTSLGLLEILAWLCRILFIPMIALGLLVSLVEPETGLTSVAIGLIEFLYSKNYFKKKKEEEND